MTNYAAGIPYSLVNPMTLPLAKSHEITLCYQVLGSQHLDSLFHEQKHYNFLSNLFVQSPQMILI